MFKSIKNKLERKLLFIRVDNVTAFILNSLAEYAEKDIGELLDDMTERLLIASSNHSLYARSMSLISDAMQGLVKEDYREDLFPTFQFLELFQSLKWPDVYNLIQYCSAESGLPVSSDFLNAFEAVKSKVVLDIYRNGELMSPQEIVRIMAHCWGLIQNIPETYCLLYELLVMGTKKNAVPLWAVIELSNVALKQALRQRMLQRTRLLYNRDRTRSAVPRADSPLRDKLQRSEETTVYGSRRSAFLHLSTA